MKKPPPSLVRSTSIVSSLTLLSRILGFVREILVARLFGASLFSDAYFVALRIPNLLRSIFAEGALTSAFVPVFADQTAKGGTHAQDTLRAMNTLLVLATLLLSLLGIIFSREIVYFFAPGFLTSPERFELCVLLTQIMFPYIIFVSLVSLYNGALNSVQIFGASAWAQVWMNVVLIAGAYLAGWYEQKEAAIFLSISVIIGGLIQVLVQFPALYRAGFSFSFTQNFFTGAVRQVLYLMVPAIMGAAVYQITIFINTQLASLLEPGSVSWLSYADRLIQLPIGVFTIALASVLLPTLSISLSKGNEQEFRKGIIDALRYTSFIMIPTSVFLFGFAEPLIKVMFERGEFTAYATFKTAMAVQMYSIGLWAVSCHSMLVRVCNAQKDTRTPTFVGCLILISTLILSLMFMGELTHSPGSSDWLMFIQQYIVFGSKLNLGHTGLSLASALTFYIAASILIVVIHRRTPGLNWGSFVHVSLYSWVAAGGALLGAQWLITEIGPFAVILRIAIYTALFFIGSFLLKVRELEETFALARRIIVRATRKQAPSRL